MNSTIIHPINGNADLYGYTCQGGGQVRREHGRTPNGSPMGGRWVYRDATGGLVDFDQYLNDIMERNNLRRAP